MVSFVNPILPEWPEKRVPLRDCLCQAGLWVCLGKDYLDELNGGEETHFECGHHHHWSSLGSMEERGELSTGVSALIHCSVFFIS